MDNKIPMQGDKSVFRNDENETNQFSAVKTSRINLISSAGYSQQMQGGYYNQTSTPGQYPQQQPGQYPPQQPGQYPPQQPGQYPPQQTGQYPPQQTGQYPPQQPGQYPPQQTGQYPPQQTGQYPPQQTGQYPPQQTGQYPAQHQISPQQQQMQSVSSQQNAGSNSQQPQTQTPWDPANAQQFQGDIGNEDLDENAVKEPVEGSAPPPPIDATLPGYEDVGFTNDMSAGPPPSYDAAVGEAVIVDTSKMRSITAEEAQEALVEYVSQQCCYGSGAANDMDIKDIKSTSAFHYTFETFTEGRSTKWHYIPYSGGFVDGPHMGPAPGPWDIQCGFSALFQSEVKKIEVPHTASVRPCHRCFGQGFERCWKCYGRGRIRCSFCNATGRRQEFRDGQHRTVSCHSCNGNGRKRCYTCQGTGCTRCKECKGFGQIKQYIQLTVKFSNHLSDHIVERTDMPDHLIRNVTGDTILEQVAARIGPVQNFMEEEINRQSAVLVNTHATSWATERILQQRQKLSSVPVYECDFKFNDKSGRFWVYGNQRSVYTADYPHTCCCCTIL